MTTEQEKAQLGAITLETFFKQFGNDKHSLEVLTTLFKVLMDATPDDIFGNHDEKA